jgi:HAD superfamily hydrolase (TIGR01509 family)
VVTLPAVMVPPFENVDTLFLDAGGVLVHPNWSRVSEALAREGVRVEAAELAKAEPHVRRELDVPEKVAASSDRARGWLYFDLLLARLGVEPSERTAAALEWLGDYHAAHNLWESVTPDAIVALERFRRAGLSLGVVSNANGTVDAAFDRLGLRAFFDVIVDSHHEGVEKPDPRIFEIALVRSGSRPESTLHLGDFYHVDVAGARAAGLRPVLLDAAGLYPDVDCPRVASLSELADALEASRG